MAQSGTGPVGAAEAQGATLERRLAALERQLRLTSAYSVEGFWTALDHAYAITLPGRDIRCIVCGFTAAHGAYEQVVDTCMFGGGRLERYRCPECDCIFGPMKFLDLPEAFIERDYALLYATYEEGASLEQEVRAFHSLAPVRDGAYVNWGCGAWSGSVTALRAEGWDVWGYEPHAETADPFVVTSDAGISTTLAGIFSNNVIEHFRDPVAAMRWLGGFLRPGGEMAHSTPCYEYRYGFTRFHSVFLLGRSVEVLARRSGFEIVRREAEGEYGNVVFRKLNDPPAEALPGAA